MMKKNNDHVITVAAILLALLMTATPSEVAAQDPAKTEKERRQMIARVMANPLIAARAKEHKTRVIRVYSGQGDTATTLAKYQQNNITAIVFNYSTNKATRYVLETKTGILVSEQVLSGRVQPSEEEIELATTIIKSDSELATLLKAGNKVTGGFIVDGPNKSAPDHRFIQMRIVTPDLRRTQKVVVVDLTSDSIAAK